MLTTDTLSEVFTSVSAVMTRNRDYLVSLDQVGGDGDLGVSMDDGFAAVASFLGSSAPRDLGQAFRQGARVLNEAAPSSLGTILSFGLMGMARSLRGLSEADLSTTTRALRAGTQTIMARAECAPGEKTVLDALLPAVQALEEAVGIAPQAVTQGREGSSAGEAPLVEEGTLADPVTAALRRAAQAAAAGSAATRQMRAVHGRAAYSADRSVGVLDGGAEVGRLLFDGILAWRTACPGQE
ncbi:dihydroxyacetone kinase subunit L [Actinomyces wuliandei]|uniref:dihydroxyacetone kinase subunit L n=1 Tax=Actinomyces wuliandei TaxID=2057743 RepID=UPI0019D43BCF|nr:dihydroxyacetone kinase subunit L [Actinomyces wuliandei]